MKKATFGGVTKQNTPSEQNCSRVFVGIFVNRLSVERNHSLNDCLRETVGLTVRLKNLTKNCVRCYQSNCFCNELHNHDCFVKTPRNAWFHVKGEMRRPYWVFARFVKHVASGDIPAVVGVHRVHQKRVGPTTVQLDVVTLVRLKWDAMENFLFCNVECN